MATLPGHRAYGTPASLPSMHRHTACLLACWLTGSRRLDCLCHLHVWLVLTGQKQQLVSLKQDLQHTVDLRVIPNVSCLQRLQTVAVRVDICQQLSQVG